MGNDKAASQKMLKPRSKRNGREQSYLPVTVRMLHTPRN